VWHGGPPPARASDLLDQDGPRRLADVLFDYWTAAIEPHWPAMRAVLDEDVAYRAGELARGGAAAMLAGMHPELSIRGDTLSIAKKRPPSTRKRSSRAMACCWCRRCSRGRTWCSRSIRRGRRA
jgi:hypothetical protein